VNGCNSKDINQSQVPLHLWQAGFSPSVLGRTRTMIPDAFSLSTGELEGMSGLYLHQEERFHPKMKTLQVQ
jgi:hypothetical protein